MLLFALCNAAGWFWLQNRTYEEEYAKEKREVQTANRAFVEHTEQVINQTDTLLRAARGYYIQADSIENAEEFIFDLDFKKRFIEKIYILDSQGSIIIPIADQGKKINAHQRDYFLFHSSTEKDELYISPVGIGKITGKEQFRMSRRINRPNGSFGGVVLIPVEPKAFADYYRKLLPHSDNAAVLIGTIDKRIRARSPYPTDDLLQKPVDSPTLWNSFNQNPSGSYRGISVIDSIERQFIYDKVGDLPLVIVTGFSDKDVQHNVAEQMLAITLASLSATLIVTMLAAILTVIERQRESMQKLATVDALTGIFNRRHLMSIGLKEITKAQRYKTPLSLIMLDIDHFKKVNDTWGHPAGDRVLQVMSCIMASAVRNKDIVGRLGGEEFLIILPETNEYENKIIAERIRCMIEECDLAKSDDQITIFFKSSIGIVTLAGSDVSFDNLLSRVDKALYQAKETGRNRVVVG